MEPSDRRIYGISSNSDLVRRYVDGGSEGYQFILPVKYRARDLEGMHDEVGHLGFERPLHLVLAKFYWPKMAQC